MSDYKSYLMRQLGIRESSLKPSGIQPSDVDPKELEMGVDDEAEHSTDPEIQKKIALQHLKGSPDYYSRLKSAGIDEEAPRSPQDMISPTVRNPAVIAMAVRGSSTGGLPSGADRGMSLPNVDGIDVSRLSKGQLGGYEPVLKATDNSELVNRTPINPQINSTSIKTDNPQTQIDPHPHQVQTAQGEEPQTVTGASDDGDESLTLKMAMPKGVDVDIQENYDGYDEYEHGSDEDNNRDNPEFQKKDEEEFRKSRSASPVGDEIRKSMGINETFARHLKLMNETIDSRNLNECDCGPTCNCDGKDDDKEISAPIEKVEEKYSAPFAKMRGLANLGERRVSKNGLWESTLKPGESTPQKWHMDKKRAGMVPDTMLQSIKERLVKKAMLNETETSLLEKINEVLKKRSSK